LFQRIVIWLMLLLPGIKATAQQPYSYSFNERHAFGCNEIYYLHQDKKGNMWIGCNDGLYKYNGICFKQFTHPGQSGRSISFIREDKYGRIWCQNFTGQIFCIENDVMSIAFDASTTFSYYPVFDIHKEGTLYVGGQNEILICGRDKKLRKVLLDKQDKTVITAIGCMADGSVVAVSDKIYKYRNDKVVVLTKTNDEGTFSKMARRRGNFEYLGSRLLFFCEIAQSKEYALAEIKGDSVIVLSVLPNSLTQGRLYSINAVSGEDLWLNTQHGTVCVDAVLHPKYGKAILSGSNVSDIIKDNEGNYWLATLESGIHIVPNMNIVQHTRSNSGLLDNNTTSLYYDAGRLFVGYFNGGVSALEQGVYRGQKFDKNVRYTSAEKIDRSPVDGRLVFCHNYLSVKPAGASAWKNLEGVFNVRDFTFLPDGQILYATGRSAGVLTVNGSETDSVKCLREMSSRCVAYDPVNERKWVGFNDGVFYFDGSDRSSELRYKGKKVYGTCMNYSRGVLWIGTVSDGLLGVRGDRVVYNYSEQNGLRGKNVRVVMHDGDALWVATEKGINIIDLHNGEISGIDKYDGLPATEINDIVVRDGMVTIASTSGLFSFPKALQGRNNRRPDIFIDKVLINDRLANHAEGLDLAYDHNKLVVYFHTSGLGEKSNYTYYFMLRGYDTSWQKAGRNIDHVSYSSLSPGQYSFSIKTVNEDGYSSVASAGFSLVIGKPVWQRWWFYWLIVIGSSILVSFIFAGRIRAIKSKAKLEQLIRSSQLTALKAQMNPHFVFNALNSIQDLILKNDVRASNIYLGRFSELMRKVLDASGKDSITLQEEIDILSLYLDLEKLRFGESFVYTVDINPAFDLSAMRMPSMIIQPFIENAIKHGLLHKHGEKRLQVLFTFDSSHIQCTITDNGVGRKASALMKERSKRPHSGFAIKATEKRLDLLNDYHKEKIGLQITDLEENGIATGTAVKLTLPYDIVTL
jgi:ligand-binding sensor domain-containing protein